MVGFCSEKVKNRMPVKPSWLLIFLTALFFLACSLSGRGRLPAGNLEGVTFISNWTASGRVQFTNGEYREAMAPGSISELSVKLTDKVAYGKITGEDIAAVIIVTDPGGSGTFYDLAVLVKDTEEWSNVDAVSLGDRVKIHSIVIEKDKITVDLTSHGPEDPMCCPTVRAVKSFVLNNGRLIEAGENTDSPDDMLTGTVWKWQHSMYNNDTKSVPSNPGHYTLKLLPEGRVSIRADCNVGGGVYKLDGSQITIEINQTTMALCEPESLAKNFLKDLDAAALYFFKGSTLYIDLKYDTGTMKFSR